jgi:deazaflavin-dependent oxidoreductase (nitroreductase family)
MMEANKIPQHLRDFIGQHRDLYVKSGGTQGHFTDGRGAGGLYLSFACLIKYKGRKSGKTMITPLSYGHFGGEIVIIASKGGSDVHPAWYLNVHEAKEIDLQIATTAWRASVREPTGAEREKVWDYMAANYPFYNTYKKSTERIIPVVMLKPLEAIPVFKESDLTG